MKCCPSWVPSLQTPALGRMASHQSLLFEKGPGLWNPESKPVRGGRACSLPSPDPERAPGQWASADPRSGLRLQLLATKKSQGGPRRSLPTTHPVGLDLSFFICKCRC